VVEKYKIIEIINLKNINKKLNKYFNVKKGIKYKKLKINLK